MALSTFPPLFLLPHLEIAPTRTGVECLHSGELGDDLPRASVNSCPLQRHRTQPGLAGQPEHRQLAEGRTEQAVVPLGWGVRAHVESLNHTLLIYSIPPGACRPLGMSHLLAADLTALAHRSLPREGTRCSHALPPLPSNTLRRGSFVHVSRASFSSLQLHQKSCQMCQRTRAQ